jgi:ATP phosphoribosyltransferase regulatory subunit
MTLAERWLLPEGVDEALPKQAEKIEHLRRKLLDVHHAFGYQLVIPPLLEYLDSLLTGAGSDLENETFKVIDQLSGRMMGIRADFTSQVARIDAHCLKENDIQRLCYCGSVLRTIPAGLDGTRSPIQLGAELYGHGGIESDIEIISLMIETLNVAQIDALVLDLGHVDIVRGVMNACQLTQNQQDHISEFLTSKDVPELARYVDSQLLTTEQKAWLVVLPKLCGGEEVLGLANTLLKGISGQIDKALKQLSLINEMVRLRFPTVKMHFDLSDLVSYSYHTGLVFAAYVPGYGNAIARGGRYNNIGEVFGRSRPATGFSTDLKALVDLSDSYADTMHTVFAPMGNDSDLWSAVKKYRQQGYRVVQALDKSEFEKHQFQFKLELVGGAWVLTPVNS